MAAMKSVEAAILIASGYPGTTTRMSRFRFFHANASSTASANSPFLEATTWLQAA